jgi:hypothetical protein
MASSLCNIDRSRLEPTASDTRKVEKCETLNDPHMTFLRARKMANRIEDPETLIRYYRAALEIQGVAAASALLYRLCGLFDETPDVLVREFGGDFLLEDWVPEESYLVEMIKQRIRNHNLGGHWDKKVQGRSWGAVPLVDTSSAKRVSIGEIIGILEDLALRFAEKAESDKMIGNPRGMRQELWKCKGVIEAADLLRKAFRP